MGTRIDFLRFYSALKEGRPVISLPSVDMEKVNKHSESYYIYTLLNRVKLKDIMTTQVESMNVDEPFSRVEEKFREHGIRHLPVVDRSLEVIGIITQRDLYKIQSPRKMMDGSWHYDKNVLDRYVLKSVMTGKPKTLTSDNTAAEAVSLMVKGKYGCIPIVDDRGILSGIVTQVDILKLAQKILDEGKSEKGG